MNGTILVAYDGSEASRTALALAGERAKALKRKLVILTVLPPQLEAASFTSILLPGAEIPRLKQDTSYLDTARKNLEVVAQEWKKAGVEIAIDVRTGDAADEIISAADDTDAEQVFIGFKGYVKRLPYGIGSTADKVLRYTNRTVTIVRPPESKTS